MTFVIVLLADGIKPTQRQQ